MEKKLLQELDEEKTVSDVYSEKAKIFLEKGYRTNPAYIANKAVSDWDLFLQTDISGKDILNVGCFEPIDEIFFAGSVRSWVAIDLNPEAISMAKKIAAKYLSADILKKTSFLVADATKLPFENDRFDIAISFSAIEHIPEKSKREKSIAEMARVTKKGGYVIVTVPNKYSFFSIIHKRLMESGRSDYGFAHLYTRKELKDEMLRAGLRPIKFSSEMRILSSTPYSFLNIIFRLFQSFGDRIGFLSIKE